MVFKTKYDLFVEKKRLHKDNMIKEYAMIFNYCSKTIQLHICESSNYDKNIWDNLITLSEAIKELMHSAIDEENTNSVPEENKSDKSDTSVDDV